ncbi:MAG: transglycosylase domain-containing protein [Candidatus Dormibacteria bacterium]
MTLRPDLTPRRSLDASARAARLRAIQSARHRRRRQPSRSQRVLLGLITAALVLTLGGWGGVQVAFAVLDGKLGQPPAPRFQSADSLVLDRNGVLIADLHPSGDRRVPVPEQAISPLLVQATVAIEDRNFWREGAANPSRVAVAALQNLTHQRAQQGASTITQQLAKVRYLNDTKTLDRKVRELFVARTLDKQLTKTEILDQYLNAIYYGHGATGIEAAAETYFGVPASKLDLAEAAMLAGLPNHPTDLDPFRHPLAAVARQESVLLAMQTSGDITAAQVASALAEKLPYTSGDLSEYNLAPAFVDRVVHLIKKQLQLDPYTAGLRVRTSLDLNLEMRAQGIVTKQVDAIVRSNHATDGALVSIDPSSGEVLAYVGGAGLGHPGSEIDLANVPRQPGSTFKIFTYTSVIAQRKATMISPILDAPLVLPSGTGQYHDLPYMPKNYDLKFHGVLPLQQALGNSLNVPAIKTAITAGIDKVVDQAHAFGVSTPSLDQPSSYYGHEYSLTLGTHEVPLWQMAQAGSVLAAGGTLHPARFVDSVRDATGAELWPQPAKPKQVVDPGAAYIMNHIMSDDSNRAIEFGLHSALTLDGHVVAAKTGTTEAFRDNLTVGWTPHLATATWIGNADNTPLAKGTTGVVGAAPIWHAFMAASLPPGGDGWPSQPSDILSTLYNGKPAYFLTGTGPGTCGFGSMYGNVVVNGNVVQATGGPGGGYTGAITYTGPGGYSVIYGQGSGSGRRGGILLCPGQYNGFFGSYGSGSGRSSTGTTQGGTGRSGNGRGNGNPRGQPSPPPAAAVPTSLP